MDVQLVKTFLEVNRTRHFARASETLCVTQAAVSARIAQLEHLVGAPLFVRQRNNIQLTATGERLLPQAEALITAWNRLLMHKLGTGTDRQVIVVGCLPSIGEIFFEDSLTRLTSQQSEVFLQLELLNSTELLPRLRNRSLDVGLLYEPVIGAHIMSVKLTEVPLVLVSSTPLNADELQDADLIQINWGTSFDAQDTPLIEAEMAPLLRVDSTRMARNILLSRPAVARLPIQQVQPEIEAGRLFRLEFAEPINRELFLVHHEALVQEETLQTFTQSLRQLVS